MSFKPFLAAQGDILLRRVDIPLSKVKPKSEIARDPDGAIVAARGEVSGHRHAIYGGGSDVMFFRDDGLAHAASSPPGDLYIGHILVGRAEGVPMQHEEHGAIHLEKGVYEVRRQQEWTAEKARIVAD